MEKNHNLLPKVNKTLEKYTEKNQIDISRFLKLENIDFENLGSVGLNTLIDAGLAMKISDNLYKATVNPTSLMKIGEGYGSAVMGEGGIIKQAGFLKVGVITMLPILVFKAAALITGQYYLHKINLTLNSIKNDVEKLQQIYKEKDLSKLLSISNLTKDLFKNTEYDDYEYNLIRDKLQYLDEMEIFCNLRVDRCKDALNDLYIDFKTVDENLVQSFIKSEIHLKENLSKKEEAGILKLEKRIQELKMREKYFSESHESNKEKINHTKVEMVDLLQKIKIHEVAISEVKLYCEGLKKNIESLRSRSEIKRRFKKINAFINIDDLFYYLNLIAIIIYLKSNLKLLETKMLYSLEKKSKVNECLKANIKLIEENEISGYFKDINKLTINFDKLILEPLNSSRNFELEHTTYINQNFKIYKDRLSLLYSDVEHQETFYKKALNNEIFITVEDDATSFFLKS